MVDCARWAQPRAGSSGWSEADRHPPFHFGHDHGPLSLGAIESHLRHHRGWVARAPGARAHGGISGWPEADLPPPFLFSHGHGPLLLAGNRPHLRHQASFKTLFLDEACYGVARRAKPDSYSTLEPGFELRPGKPASRSHGQRPSAIPPPEPHEILRKGLRDRSWN